MQKIIDLTGVQLETERLVLRPWQQKDLQDFYTYASVPGVGECAGWKHHENIAESEAILNRFIEGRHTFALVDKRTGKVIGSLGLMPPDIFAAQEDETAFGCEIGYVLSRDDWGRGLMTEAVKRAVWYCMEELGMDYVTCAHFMENDRSRRVIEKCGFVFCREVGYETQLGEIKPSRLYVIRKR